MTNEAAVTRNDCQGNRVVSDMTKDAFGHSIEFRTIMRVGKSRKDGKYPVSYVFMSTGARINKIMTRDQIDKDIEDSINRGSPMEVHGWTRSTH